MNAAFYISAAVAVFSTVMVITRLHAIHALLYMIVSLLAVAMVFFVIGAPFVAALEVIVYAGAIMVLFVFAMMMLDLGKASVRQERKWLPPSLWVGPLILVGLLLVEFIIVVNQAGGRLTASAEIGASEVGISLLGPYLLGIELASMLLLAGLVGAYYIGRK
jgi:NADH-quinone oxidoreductase subunit J